MRHRALAALVVVFVLGIAGIAWFALARSGKSAAEDALTDFQGSHIDGEALPPPVPQSGWETSQLVPSVGASKDHSAQIQELWKPMVSGAKENKWTAWAYILDAETGDVLLDEKGTEPHTPASTMKILTALTALEALDPLQTLQTGTSLEGGTLYLWGQGDLLLAPGVGTAETNGYAGVGELAESTAEALAQLGASSVKLTYQDRLFEGDKRPPVWAKEEVTEFGGDVGPYAVDTGRTYPEEWDFVADSSKAVATLFAEHLEELGIRVQSVTSGHTPDTAKELAHVDSAPVYAQVTHMLRVSDNTMAEQYCHLAAAAAGAPTTFPGAAANMMDELTELGVNTLGLVVEDCSGLASGSKITGVTLTGALQASLHAQSGARELVRMLPRGGLEGTLSSRHTEGAGAGNLQAKTGSLGSVSSLAGVITTAGGQNLLLAVGVDNAPDWMGYLARDPIDDFVEGLADLD